MQLTFGDAGGQGQRKRTRKQIFLAEMEQVVPWNALLKLIAPHYPKMGRHGWQPYALPRLGEERGAGAGVVRVVEPVDGATTLVAAGGVNPPGGRGNPPKTARNGAKVITSRSIRRLGAEIQASERFDQTLLNSLSVNPGCTASS